MNHTRDQFQTLLDAFGDAIQRKDFDRVSLIRRTLDKKLDEVFIELRKPKAPPRPTVPPPPPRNPTFTTPPPLPTKKPSAPMPPRKITCTKCNGTGRITNDKGFYICKDCNGDGYTLDASQEWLDFVMKQNGVP